MSRYELPLPICRHKETCMVSSHLDLRGVPQTEAMASTYCCSRPACIEDASDWVRATTRKPNVFIKPFEKFGDVA